MANFEAAVNKVLGNEGGLSEDPNDPGGITNRGISLRFLREVDAVRLKRYSIFEAPTEQTIRELTEDQTKLIYRGEFWEMAPFEKIMNQMLANYIFDMAVLHGITQAIKLTQRAIWAAQKKKDFIKDDGILGAFTLQAINQCSFMMLPAMIAQRDMFCRHLVIVNPTQKGSLNGWLERCYRV